MADAGDAAADRDPGQNLLPDSGTDAALGTDGGEDSEAGEPAKTAIGTPIGSPVGATIGAAGGTLASPDGVLSIEIPPGALTADTAVGIQPISNLAPGGVGNGYELTPEGTTFAKPVTLRFKYTKETTAGTSPSFLGVSVQNAEGYWELQWANSTLDETAFTLAVETLHFSRWSLGQHVYLEPYFSQLMPNEGAAYYVKHCVDLPKRVPGSDTTFFLTSCRKMSVTLAARILSNWAVNGVSGGNATVGIVRGDIENGYYTAPAKKPNPETVILSVDGLNIFAPVPTKAALTAEIDIIDEDRPYVGYMTFTSENPGYTLTADANITWVPDENLGDVRRYRPTGTVQATATYAGCQPVNATLTFADLNAGSLVIYTSTNAAYKNQYQFAAAASAPATLLCGDPPVAIQTMIVANATAGNCAGMPPFAALTNENHLQGSGPCEIGMITASEWSFVRDQAAD